MRRVAGAITGLLLLAAVPVVVAADPASASSRASAVGAASTCAGCRGRQPTPPPSAPPTADFTGTIRIVKDGRPARPAGAGDAGDSCPGCRWQLVIYCLQRDPNDPEDANCVGASTYCQGRGGGTAFALYLARPPEYTWRQVDVLCLGPDDGVVPAEDIGPRVAEAFAAVDLPEVGVRVQPPDGALVNVPALFSAPTPRPQTDSVTISLAGTTLSLTITATVTGYVWDFGDGVTRPTSNGGQRYASGSAVPAEGYGDPYVAHTYRGGGTRTVALTTNWVGTFDDGGTVRTVPRSETTSAQVVVKTARSELVGG